MNAVIEVATAAKVLAQLRGRNAVKDAIRRQGLKVNNYKAREITSWAELFIEEHPDSINDGLFRVNLQGVAPDYTGGTYVWNDYPANNHGAIGVLGFADGHAGTHRWSDGALYPNPVKHSKNSNLAATAPYRDLIWLRSSTTVPAP